MTRSAARWVWVAAAVACLTSASASAGEPVPPREADLAVLVTGPGGPVIHHRLSGGGALHYALRGPGTVEVKVRRRLPSAEHSPPPIPIELVGDGEPFLTMRVGQRHQQGIKAHDAGGGATSAPDIARVEVPAGGKTLEVRSPANAPDVFVVVVPSE